MAQQGRTSCLAHRPKQLTDVSVSFLWSHPALLSFPLLLPGGPQRPLLPLLFALSQTALLALLEPPGEAPAAGPRTSRSLNSTQGPDLDRPLTGFFPVFSHVPACGLSLQPIQPRWEGSVGARGWCGLLALALEPRASDPTGDGAGPWRWS